MTTTDPTPTAADLDQWLYGDDDINPDAPIEPPRDADRADRLLAARHRHATHAIEVTELARSRRAAIDEWEAAQVAAAEARIEWVDESLALWHAAVLRDDPKRATISLPNGTLKASKVPGGAEWEWVDDAATVEYLTGEAPGLVTVPDPKPPVPRPDKAAVKAAVAVVADVAAAREERMRWIAEHGHPDPSTPAPARFVAGTGVEGELVPVVDLDTGAPVPGVMVRRVTRRFRVVA